MKEIGYGILRDTKPYGIWPLPWQVCCDRVGLARQNEIDTGKPRSKYEIVPIQIGNPITPGAARPKEESPPELA